MLSFEEARQVVEHHWPDYEVAPFGYEGGSDWFLILLPETAGGRVPAVSKATGAVKWTNAYSDEYSQGCPVGKRP